MGIVCVVGNGSAGELLCDLPVIETGSFAEISCPDAVIIAGQDSRIRVNSALAVIVDENYGGELPQGVQLVTCGISPKNTVSVTSRTEDKLTLALNRSLKTLGGVAEPMEIPVPVKKGFAEYDLMAEFAARLLIQ